MAFTLYDKIWNEHVVHEEPDGACLLYVDRHIVHEVDSPQAFAGLRRSGLPVKAPQKTLLVVDHNVPTSDRSRPNPDPVSAAQIAYFAENAGLFVGALACGIGTSEVEHVLVTQTLIQRKSKNMRAVIDGVLPPGVTAKDLILAIIGEIGAAGGIGCVVEFCGEAVRALTMEGRMTICNMSVEAGARTAIIAPDEKTYEYLKDRPKSPKGRLWDDAVRYWDTLRSDEAAEYDREIRLDASALPPLVTWGTNPEQVTSITGSVPRPEEIADGRKRDAAKRSLAYMGLRGGERIAEITINRVFIGSCANARIEDLREAARVVDGKTVNPNVSAMVVPGSGLVKLQAEAEGLDKVFLRAGFDWREPGCSMCLAMNPDKLIAGERCASTSNRNFEGRQGYKGRTHLVSPAMAAAAAIAGKFVDVRQWPNAPPVA